MCKGIKVHTVSGELVELAGESRWRFKYSRGGVGIGRSWVKDLVKGHTESTFMKGHEALPILSKVQVGLAVSVFRANYWIISCWICRFEDHGICLYLKFPNGIYRKYKYYPSRIQSSRQSTKYLEQRIQWLLTI